MKIQEAVTQFMQLCEIKGLRPSTLDVYQRALDSLAEYFGETLPVTTLTGPNVVQWQIHLVEKYRTPNTLATILRPARLFFRWLYEGGYIPENPPIHLPRIPKKVGRVLRDDEVQTLFLAIRKRRTVAILRFMLETGVRAKELVNLRRSDVDLAAQNAVVADGKGGKGRRVYFSAKTADVLRQYWQQVGSEWAFAQRDGAKLTYRGLHSILSAAFARAGLQGASPHTLRRTFATRYLSKGGSVAHLQLWLGHGDVSTTMRYVDPALVADAAARVPILPDEDARKKLEEAEYALEKLGQMLSHLPLNIRRKLLSLSL